MSGPDFAYLRHRAGFDQQAAARFLNVSLRTIRRYEKYGAPRVAVLALAARGGEYPGWEGFMFRDGELRTPQGDLVTRTVVENQDYLVYLHWWRGWEAHRKQCIAPAAAEQPRNRHPAGDRQPRAHARVPGVAHAVGRGPATW